MRIIDADALIKRINQYYMDRPLDSDRWVINNLAEMVRTQPTISPKTGRWIDEPIYKQTMDGKTWDGYTYCSECREMHEYGYRSNYCPNCGAAMEGEEDDSD